MVNCSKIVTFQLCKMHWYISFKKSFDNTDQSHKNTEGIHDNQRHVCQHNSTNANMMWPDTQLFGLNPGIGFGDYTRTHILPILQATFHTSLSYFSLDWVHLATRIETHKEFNQSQQMYLSKFKCNKDNWAPRKIQPQNCPPSGIKVSALQFSCIPSSHWSLLMSHFCLTLVCCRNLSFSIHSPIYQQPLQGSCQIVALILIFSWPFLSAP